MRWPYVPLLLVAACGFQAGGSASVGTDGQATPVDAKLYSDAPPINPDAVTATDVDGDGVPDATDNCRMVPNQPQYDEDADGVGDACDNCPHVANAGQTNTGEINAGQTADAVGDACDPRPAASGDHIVMFLGFNAASDIAGWQTAGSGANFAVEGGKLVQKGASDLALIWKNGLGVGDAWIETSIKFTTVDTAHQFLGAYVLGRFDRSTGLGLGAGCGEMSDSGFDGGQDYAATLRYNGPGFTNKPSTQDKTTIVANHEAIYRIHGRDLNNYECTSGLASFVDNMGSFGGTGIGLATHWSKVGFAYLVVID